MATDNSPTRPIRPRRKLWAFGPALLITLAILIAIKITSLNGLPDIGDPFDIEAFARPIPDEANAFVLYKRAFEKLGKEPANPSFVWSTADPSQRRWLDENREALGLWREGTGRPDALYIPPKTLTIATLLPVMQAMRSFGRLAILEGTRLEAEGDLKGALDWYLAVLRSSRHCGRRGFPIERLVGIAVASMGSTRLLAWAVNPGVDTAMLRRALDAVVECEAMTPPSSDSFKCEYISFLNTVADPAYQEPDKLLGNSSPWIWTTPPGKAFVRAERSFKSEPERSRRVYRLIMANWLEYCDRPRTNRPAFATLPPSTYLNPFGATSGFELFVPEAAAPATVKVFSPEDLAGWFHSTLYAEIFSPNFGAMEKAIRRDRGTFANLQITLANEIYKKEKGEYPEKVEALIGPYLKALPEGYVPIADDTKDGKPKGR